MDKNSSYEIELELAIGAQVMLLYNMDLEKGMFVYGFLIGSGSLKNSFVLDKDWFIIEIISFLLW